MKVNAATRNLISVILFLEALDATMLYVALPKITLGFGGILLQGNWIIIGFLLSVALSMFLSSWFAYFLGAKKAFLISQAGYIITSIACGFSDSLGQLVIFRILQGAFAGILIPIGVNYWIKSKKEVHHKLVGCRIYLYEMTFALILGPIYAGYVVNFIGWRALFFIKVPISIICFILSWLMLKAYRVQEKKAFHWKGFVLFSMALYFLIYSIIKIGDENSNLYLAIFTILVSSMLITGFIKYELNHKNPIINFHLFKNPIFSLGVFLQSIVMIIFMGAIFILSIFLIGVQKFNIIDTALIISSLGIGLLGSLLVIRPIRTLIPDIIIENISLIILALSMFLLTRITRDSSKLYIAFIVFLEGSAAGFFRVVNANSIFNNDIANNNLEDMGTIFTFVNQFMVTIGVAVSVMIVKSNLAIHGIPNLSWAIPENAKKAYQLVFYILSALPIAGILIASITRIKLNFEKK